MSTWDIGSTTVTNFISEYGLNFFFSLAVVAIFSIKIFKRQRSIMAMTKRWASCKCFYKRNFYIKQLDEHLEYKNDQQFIFEYQNQLSGVNAEDVLNEIKTEMARRKKRFKLIEENRHNILEKYKPFSIDNFVGFTDLQTIIPKEVFSKVYKFSVMDSSLCDMIKEEIGRCSPVLLHLCFYPALYCRYFQRFWSEAFST